MHRRTLTRRDVDSRGVRAQLTRITFATAGKGEDDRGDAGDHKLGHDDEYVMDALYGYVSAWARDMHGARRARMMPAFAARPPPLFSLGAPPSPPSASPNPRLDCAPGTSRWLIRALALFMIELCFGRCSSPSIDADDLKDCTSSSSPSRSSSSSSSAPTRNCRS